MHTIFWRRLDTPGHDHAVLRNVDEQWHIEGCALFVEGSESARLSYVVRCDSEWRTINAQVTGWIGQREVNLTIEADAKRQWRLNGGEVPGVAGCVDLDLSMTPCTNLLPIRRLQLAVGVEAELRSAWLLVPELRLEPLPQRYRRVSETTYQYESPTQGFAADLRVNAVGFVTSYPSLWEIESATAP